ncbi:MazG nucleotide pyrophosphohydrolase domain-containing protein [Streptomyces sp. NPDC049879]|uniref:MazG nucleotide pyrophosphohydrolase domain-containing protein n=1 Tax=Streptomyces sp. NPDC049879 TaxID=3365598 RepID=UPI00379D3220
MDIADAQRLAWENKLAKGFNTTDVAVEFGLLTAEVGEAFTAWLKQRDDLGEELADVFLYLTAIAQMRGIDLASEVAGKIEKNRRRVYARDERGVLHRVREGTAGEGDEGDEGERRAGTGRTDTPRVEGS